MPLKIPWNKIIFIVRKKWHLFLLRIIKYFLRWFVILILSLGGRWKKKGWKLLDWRKLTQLNFVFPSNELGKEYGTRKFAADGKNRVSPSSSWSDPIIAGLTSQLFLICALVCAIIPIFDVITFVLGWSGGSLPSSTSLTMSLFVFLNLSPASLAVFL